ncbi:cysteine synthase CysM [Acidithiobacillus sp. AMEEHan]|uniref:cysteine synthase CysM n=1 Tax=Acidithiobacillus sp. AMEEHan TaxID=2994951 RepID=UPI0027E4980C|nr:cysteine synthase CysM [Acidithiobacillus sp. AMEEHan]
MSGLADFVGNTPLCELRRLSPNPRVRLFGKLEGNNPAGSVKDRPALHMIRRALERGTIRPGDRLVEATSGNTGIALAMAASVEGLKITLIMPENMSLERRQVMRAFGADIELTPADASMEGAIDRARAMVDAGEAIMLDQFSNPDNPEAHTRTTGPEIWRDSRGQVTHFVSAMGTTGTIMGTSRYLRQVHPAIQIVGVQPAAGAKIPGIRRWPKEYVPKIYQPELVDRVIDVGTEEAEEMTRRLAREEGILAGISSGGAVAAALRVAETLDQGFLVAIICDRGDRYLSTGVFPA